MAMLKKWSEAEEFFEITATAPGSVPAAIQMEALKKLRLVQLISKGKVGFRLLLSLLLCFYFYLGHSSAEIRPPYPFETIQGFAIPSIHLVLPAQRRRAQRAPAKRAVFVLNCGSPPNYPDLLPSTDCCYSYRTRTSACFVRQLIAHRAGR